MKRTISHILAALLLTIFTAGCDDTEDRKTNADIQEETEAVTEIPEPTLPERDRTAEAKAGEFLIDDAGVLSDADFDAINEYAAWFTKTFRTNAAVAITDDIGDKSAADKAAEYYEEFYGNANGILLLVNNDTGSDYILRKGSPSAFVTGDDIELLYADISPLLVTGDYLGAVTKTFEMFEKTIPEFVTDRTNSIEKEDLLAVNDMLSEACGENERLCIVYMGAGEDEIKGYADSEAKKCIADGENTAVLFVNPSSGLSAVRASGEFASLEQAEELFKTAVADYFVKEGGDSVGLAELYRNFAGK